MARLTSLRAPTESQPESVSGEARGPQYSTPVRRKVLGINRNSFVQWSVFIVLAILVASPLLPTIYQSFRSLPLYRLDGIFTLDNYLKLFTVSDFGTVIFNTLAFAALATVFALVIAVPLAIIVVKTNVPGRQFLALMMQWPFFVSALVLAFGWVLVYSPAGFISAFIENNLGFTPWNLYSLTGMALIQAVGIAPIAYVFCANSLRQSDSSLESAAQTTGASPLRILLSVVLPMLRPPIVYSSILMLSMSVEALSIPLIIGLPNDIVMFSTFLYENGITSTSPDYGLLASAAVVVLLGLIGLIILQGFVLKKASRFISVRGKATQPRVLNLGSLKWIATVVIAGYLLIGNVIPMVGLVARSFTTIFSPLVDPLQQITFSNYTELLSVASYRDSITNSLIVSTIGAIFVSLLAMMSAVIARRTKFRQRRLVEYLALSPQAIPGLVVSIGLFWAFSAMPPQLGGDFLRGSLVAIIIAFGLRALPTAFSSIAPATMQIGAELDDAARVSGADWLRVLKDVLTKLLRPAFIGAVLLVFVTMMKEYAAAVFLTQADTQVMGTEMLSLWTQGLTGPVASLAVVQILICTIVVLVANSLMKGRKNA